MTLNDVLCGFRVTEARESKELCGTLWTLRHEKTGAPLYWLDNGAENMVFSVAFNTVPWDDTGVFHILEHSVLCGSEKYPVKEPFLDLLKSSLNTFLNAMTFPDKTMYPVASRNEKDFLNLVSVYLDAVFCPMITKNPSIFLQEGTRIDFSGDAPAFNGVVYNEMKGACGSLNTRIINELERLLYPDSPYGFVSGGDPRSITALTYEGFLDAYKTFYHPANSVIYLDGAVSLDAVLPLIDGYLSAYEADGVWHTIPLQTPVEGRKAVVNYEIGENESPDKKTCIVRGKIAGEDKDLVKMQALGILRSYLFGSNEAPVKRAVLKTGLVEDVSFTIYDGILQPFTALVFRNTEEAHRDALVNAVRTAANELLAAPTDTDALFAEIDKRELNVKEPEEPQGIDRAIELMSGVVFCGDPLAHLEYDALLSELRRLAETDYYKDLIREFLLDDACVSEIVFLPDPAMGKKNAEEEQARLEKKLAAMDENALAAAKARFDAFKLWQDTPDSDAQKATLPTLSVSDLPEAPAPYITEQKTQGQAAVSFHPAHTSGISYVRLYFAAEDLSPEALPVLSFVTDLLGCLPTKSHDAASLERALKRTTGWFNPSLLTLYAQDGGIFCRLAAGFSAMSRKLPQVVPLIGEILTETLFTEKEKIKEILTQTRDRLYRAICASGSRYAGRRALAACHEESAANDAIRGVEYYRWLKAFENDYDARFEGFAAEADALLKKLCVSARLTLSETADDYHTDCFGFFTVFPAGEACEAAALRMPVCDTPRKEAFLVPGSVSYAAQGVDLRRCAARFEGGMAVLSGMMTYGYLWDEIRVRGGAYGCGCMASDADILRCTTFRDPTPMRSLSVFGNAGTWLTEQCAKDAPIDNYIISAVAGGDPLHSPCEWGFSADGANLQGITQADRVNRQKEILAATKESLRAYVPMLEEMARQGSVCVIGSKEALAEADGEWIVEEL